ncbi:LacI family DNA-binding transcriptional regulator [Ruminiclostridium cellobioparum]|jgi:LacI family transcriptional regulator|uniref:LacI family DNA-binding transcriptional regulator n=1 Tax=Ruminiclostridium cellobioparum TaxID=29355 RepID=UPI0006880029|nr:LacI family DNA-binding transcriptional regulator [Ruminiclostridium cellobioparum]
MKKATVQIKQIAEQLGVSQSTVSIVLNGRGDKMRISKATQQKVQEAAKDMNYQPNIYARRLRGAGEKHSGRIIAIFWNSRYTDDLGKFFKGASAAIEKNMYNIEFMVQLFDQDKLSHLKDLMTSQKYNGIIVCAPSDKDLAFLNSETFDVPLVLSNRSDNKYSGIYTDNFVTGRNCAKLFAEKGHKKAGLIGVEGKSNGSMVRGFGFTSGCEQLGIEIRSEWIAKAPDYDIAGGYQCAQRIIECGSWPSAIFILTDTQALGAMIAFKDHNVKVPEDMEILAYGNNEMFNMMSPSISSVAVSREIMAENAVNLLMTKMENNITEPISRVLVPEYSFRDSFSINELNFAKTLTK